jgi:L-ascorbate metabolism protein UlaG (beta-lactamase superfamily)
MRVLINQAICILKFGILILALSGCNRSFDKFWNDQTNLISALDRSSHQTEVQYFGVSSFLIRDGNNILIIDGFFSRPKKALFRSLQPDMTSIRDMLDRSEIDIKSKCDSTIAKGSKLDAIVAMHGHYDHALDTPLIAALTGATLIADDVVTDIKTKTHAFFPDVCSIENLHAITEAHGKTKIDLENLIVTLVPVDHSTNPASVLLERSSYDPNWTFPTRVKNMKEGAGFAAHVQTRRGAILVVPTAGNIGTSLKDPGLQADVIFLGIGGLGWGSRNKAETYWAETVLASGAKRVVPVHWDSMSPALDPDLPALNAPFYEQLDRALFWLKEFADADPQINLVSVPIFRPFDPFSTAIPKG